MGYPLIRMLGEMGHVDATLVRCPLCDWTLVVPPVQASDQLAAAFGMSGETLARLHAEQEATRAESDVDRHLRTHTPMLWLTALMTKASS